MSSPKKNSQYQAYSAASRTVPKTRQVVMLYDGSIRFLKQAKEAIEENRIEDRFKLLLKTSQIIVGLRNSIDYETGGEVAKTLERFYTGIDVRILSINFSKNGAEQCDAIIEDLKSMRDVWESIDKNMQGTTPGSVAQPVIAQAQASSATNVTLSA